MCKAAGKDGDEELETYRLSAIREVMISVSFVTVIYQTIA
jgi:hypothetical protein